MTLRLQGSQVPFLSFPNRGGHCGHKEDMSLCFTGQIKGARFSVPGHRGNQCHGREIHSPNTLGVPYSHLYEEAQVDKQLNFTPKRRNGKLFQYKYRFRGGRVTDLPLVPSRTGTYQSKHFGSACFLVLCARRSWLLCGNAADLCAYIWKVWQG